MSFIQTKGYFPNKMSLKLPPPMAVINPIKLAPNQSGWALSLAANAPEMAKKPVPNTSKMYCVCINFRDKGRQETCTDENH